MTIFYNNSLRIFLRLTKLWIYKHIYIYLHVPQRLATDRTNVMGTGVVLGKKQKRKSSAIKRMHYLEVNWKLSGEYLKTCRVHHMTTRKCFNWRGWSKNILMANWAVIFKTLFSAYMHTKGPWHTSIAIHTMEVVNAQSFPNTTQITVRAVIYLPVHQFITQEMR